MDLEPPGLSPEMEADKTSEGPPATQDAKKHPSLTVPHAEDLPEATTPESPPHLLSSQEYFQPPKVHSKTYPSLDLGTKDSEDLQDPSVSETPLKLDTANLPSTPSQSSAQSVISLERAISKIPLDDFIYENSISEVQEEPLPLSPTTDISKYEYPISDVQEEPLLLSPTTNISKYEDSISDVQEEPLEDTPTADISETEYSISDVQEEPLEPPPTADIPESEDYISDDHEEPLEPPPTADIPESSYEFISDKVPQTQVPESEPFPKHSVPEPSAQAKEAASADEEEAEEEELTGGTSKTAAAGSEHHARKKKEKRGCESRPVVPAKRAELVEMAKAMHRKQFDDQVNDLFQWEKNSSLKAIQTGEPRWPSRGLSQAHGQLPIQQIWEPASSVWKWPCHLPGNWKGSRWAILERTVEISYEVRVAIDRSTKVTKVVPNRRVGGQPQIQYLDSLDQGNPKVPGPWTVSRNLVPI
uniref:Family with sequence similarity 221, member B n=1 Tax=Rattus norvegicus TaxID=10116 RepID=A0ABK0LEI5_RAT